jgi:hypothetical protein
VIFFGLDLDVDFYYFGFGFVVRCCLVLSILVGLMTNQGYEHAI